MTVIMFVVIS